MRHEAVLRMRYGQYLVRLVARRTEDLSVAVLLKTCTHEATFFEL